MEPDGSIMREIGDGVQREHNLVNRNLSPNVAGLPFVRRRERKIDFGEATGVNQENNEMSCSGVFGQAPEVSLLVEVPPNICESMHSIGEFIKKSQDVWFGDLKARLIHRLYRVTGIIYNTCDTMMSTGKTERKQLPTTSVKGLFKGKCHHIQVLYIIPECLRTKRPSSGGSRVPPKRHDIGMVHLSLGRRFLGDRPQDRSCHLSPYKISQVRGIIYNPSHLGDCLSPERTNKSGKQRIGG